MNIFRLFAKLILDDTEYKKKIEEAKGSQKELLKQEQEAKVKSVAKWTGVGTAVALVANKMKSLISNTTEYAGSIKDLAQVYNQTNQTVQELNFIAQESGKNAEWVLRKAESSGKSYAEILGLTNEQYDEMVSQAHEMGLVMEDEVIDNADKLGDKVAAIKYQWQSVLVSLLAGEENAEEKLELFFERLMGVVEQFIPTIVSFVVKLLLQVGMAVLKYTPQLVSEILGAVLDVVFSTNWFAIGVNIALRIADGIINIIPRLFNSLFGWAGVNIPMIDSGSVPVSIGSSKNDYEITETIKQDITIKVESDGVTANDKAVANSLEDLIDEKLGRMLGGI